MPTDGRVSHHEFWSPGGAVAWAKTSKPPTVAAVARAKQEMQASAPHVLQAPGTGPAADGVGDCPGTGLRPANAGVEDCSGSAGTDQRPANAGVEDGPGSTGTEPASGERRSRGRSRQGRDQSVSWSCWIRQCRDGSASRIRWIRQAAFLCEKDERRIRRSGFPGTRPAAFFLSGSLRCRETLAAAAGAHLHCGGRLPDKLEEVQEQPETPWSRFVGGRAGRRERPPA